MAPNFFSKFIKTNGTRDRSSTNGSSDSVSPRTSSSLISRARSQSTSNNNNNRATNDDKDDIPAIFVEGAPHNRSLDSLATHSTQLNVTVIPPSPFSGHRDLSDSEDEGNQINSNSGAGIPASTARTTPAPPITVISPTEDSNDETPVPTPRIANPPKSTVSPTDTARTGSSTTLVSSPSNNSNSTTMSTTSSLAPAILKKQPSNKSIKKVEPVTEMSINTNHARAATAPAGAASSAAAVPASEFGQLIPSPIVESPTESTFANGSTSTNGGSVAPPSAAPSTVTSPFASTTQLQREGTNVSLNSDSKKSRPWKRQKQPTGLASAIAASGLAMANASLSAQHQAHMSNSVTSPPPAPAPVLSREPNTTSGSSIRSSSKTGHNKTRSAELSPRSTRSRKSSGSAPRRRPSVSAASEAHSEHNGGYISGLDDSSDEGSSSAEVSDDELGEDDIPVTGFAVASNKRNADFHELFPQVPEADYLIEDYGCALLRDILMQGRLYISENHICFHSNIFGWVTDAIIPISDIIGLEKKMTAFVIPNAIQITTRQEKFLFASFLARDTAYDVIFNIWRLARPAGMNGLGRSVNGADDTASMMSSGRGSLEGAGAPASLGGTVASSGGTGAGAGGGAAAKPALQARKPTQCLCGKDNQHYTEGVLDTTIPGTPDKIHSLMFGSDFLKNFLGSNQKVLDIQMTQWNPPITPGSKGSKRSLSYIKPLNGAVGPRQTKCEIEDEIMHYDHDGYLSTVTTTRTPDVPSGGVFAVKTRTCITWASSTSSRVVVTTQVDWSGRSLFRGVIGPAAIDGQKTYHAELEKAMKTYITDHKSEFLPEGAELAENGAANGAATKGAADPASAKARAAAEAAAEKEAAAAREEEERRKREAAEKEKQRKASGIKGWAWDTFDGALGVAIKSTEGMLELLKDAWDSTSSTSLLYLVILLLVISNVWTLTKVGKAREDAIKTLEERKLQERERWVQSIVTALWDELAAGKRPQHLLATPGSDSGETTTTEGAKKSVVDADGAQVPLATITLGGEGVASVPSPSTPAQVKVEIAQLLESLDSLEARVKLIREAVAQLPALDSLD